MPARAADKILAPGEPDPVDVHVGERIRAHRKLAKLSQADLGKQIGVTFQQVQKYERGTNRVSVSMLCRVAAAFRCAPADLLPEVGPGSSSVGANAAYALLALPNGPALTQALSRLPLWAYDNILRLALDIDANTNGL